MNDFRMVCKEYCIIEYCLSGILIMLLFNIFDKWVEDFIWCKYECVDFFFYGYNDMCLLYVYNIFDGFCINIMKVFYEGLLFEVLI